MNRLSGKVALITGGTSGIGRATAVVFAREGARVGFTGRDAARGAGVAREIESAGGRALFVRGDVRVAADCARAVADVDRALGPIDILFNNAGVFFPRAVPDTTEQEWDDTIDVSLKGAFLMSRRSCRG